MVLGMMVIGTSAATFTDAEEITYTEAVDVAAAIGVINGYEAADGTFYFDGDGVLTREQGAALICYLLMGKTAADKLVGSGNFTDVASDRWSAGEIDYCVSLGYIAGNGDGTFNPEGPLTGLAYGKLLLCALGYDAKVEGYENNANWATNIAVDMMAAGLTNDKIALDAQLTREAAAQMTLQALTATMVGYTTKGTSITVGGVEITSGASEAAPVEQGTYAQYNQVAAVDNLQFCEKYFPTLKLTAGTDDLYGRPAAYKWYVDADKSGNFTALKDTVAANIMKPVAETYNVTGLNDTTLAGIAKKLELEVATGTSEITAVKGDTVELYLNAVGKIEKAVKLHTELGQIVKVTKTIDPNAKYTYDVTVATASGNAFYTDKSLTGFDVATMVKDTYVTIVKGTGTATVALADSITGKQTAKGTGYTKIDGVQKFYAGNVWNVDSVNYTDTFNFYVDAKGLIIGTEKAATAPVKANIFYVTDGKFVKGDAWTSSVAKLSVINLDGSSEVLDMNITVTAGVKYVNKTTALENNTAFGDGFYAYTLTADGKVATLKAVGTTGAAATGVKDTKELLTDTNYVDFDAKVAVVNVNGTNFFATTDTNLVVIDDVYQTATTITGYTNFENIKYEVGSDEGDVTAILYTYAGDVLNTVYVLGATVTVSDAAVKGYLVKTGDEYVDALANTYQDVTYNVKGQNVTYKVVKAESYPTFATIVVTDGVAALSEASFVKANEDVEKVTDTYIVIDGTPYYFAADVAYYDVTNVAVKGVVADNGVVKGDIGSFTTKTVAGATVIDAVYTTYAAPVDGQITIKATDAASLAYFSEVLGLNPAEITGHAANGYSYAVIQFARPATATSVVIRTLDTTTGLPVLEDCDITTGWGGVGHNAHVYAGAGSEAGDSYTYQIIINGAISQTGTFTLAK